MTSGIEGAEDAVEEVDLGGIAIWNVVDLLPVNRNPWRVYPARDLEWVTHLFIHHSGRLGRPGFRGLFNSTRYVTDQKPTRNDEGFPGCAYHLWAPFEPCLDGEGRLVCFRAQLPETRCWHTGGDLNEFGESLALQGNTSKRPMSPSQVEICEAVIPYRLNALSLQRIMLVEGVGVGAAGPTEPTLSWHSEAERWGGKNKPACPGRDAVTWLTNYRSGSDWAGHLVAA